MKDALVEGTISAAPGAPAPQRPS